MSVQVQNRGCRGHWATYVGSRAPCWGLRSMVPLKPAWTMAREPLSWLSWGVEIGKQHMGVSQKWGYPIAGWLFIMENPSINLTDGWFRGSPISGNAHIPIRMVPWHRSGWDAPQNWWFFRRNQQMMGTPWYGIDFRIFSWRGRWIKCEFCVALWTVLVPCRVTWHSYSSRL